jgi:hypothetical protein
MGGDTNEVKGEWEGRDMCGWRRQPRGDREREDMGGGRHTRVLVLKLQPFDFYCTIVGL